MVEDLGHKIRSHRKRQFLTLKQLSERTGLSISFLSEIERGLAQPSMASLRKIREVLGISLLTFRAENGPEDGTDGLSLAADRERDRSRFVQDVRVVRSDRRKKLSYPGQPGFYELLTPDLNRLLEVLYIKMEPGFDSGPEAIVDPPGEKCMVIITGSLDFNVEGEVYHIEVGDSLYYPADAPVSWTVSDEDGCEGLLIITPPGF